MQTPSDRKSSSVPIDPRSSAAAEVDVLAQVVLCRVLKLGLDRPAADAHQTFFSAEGKQTLRRAVELLDPKPDGGLRRAQERLAGRPAVGAQFLRDAYDRMFGHTLRGQVCPYECEYGKPGVFRQAQELADLGGSYSAFGLQPHAAKHQRHDHIACQMEFLEFLAQKKLWAMQHGDAEMAEITSGAFRQFLRDHTGRFGPVFAVALRRADPDGFYGALGALLESYLTTICEQLGVETGPKTLQLRPDEPDTTPMACGTPDLLVQIGEGHDG